MTSCDDNLAPYIAVQLTAMAYNLKDASINFFFFHSQVSKKNIEKLEILSQKLKIQFYEILVPFSMQKICSELAKYGGKTWPGEAYYSICAHLLLPNNIDKILYIDAGDILIMGDIEDYYHYDFQGKSLIVTGRRYKSREGNLEQFNTEDLSDWKGGIFEILKGVFNSGAYVMNLDQMRKDKRTLGDYLYLSRELRKLFFWKGGGIYFGDQGILSVAFVGDIQYYNFPQIQNILYMPYNFCLWYYKNTNKNPDYTPIILHFIANFKPWNGIYPTFIERFQKKESLRSLKELETAEAGYFYLWYGYAIIADDILEKLNF